MPPERELTDSELWSMVSLGSGVPEEPKQNAEKQTPGPQLPSENSQSDLTIRDIWVNIASLCLAFTLSYTAFQSIQNLESSLNEEAHVGTASLSCIYSIFILSCNMAPLILHHIGTKWSVIFGLLGNSVYAAVHFHPHHYTLIPASILLGVVMGPMWASQSTHIVTCAVRYAELTNQHHNVIISQFMGIFYMFFGMTQIFGNLISASVLDDAGWSSSSENETEALERTCGPLAGGSGEIDAGNLPTKKSQTTLFSLYLAISFMAILAAIPMDSLGRVKNTDENAPTNTKDSIACLCATTLQMLKNPKVLMLAPFLIFCGMEQAFLYGDFTKSYVSCAIGVESVGIVMICYGACDAIFAFAAGRISKYTGQNPLIVAAGVVTAILMILMLVWQPSPRDYALFFLITGGWGLADGIWQTQLSTVLGDVFSDATQAIFSLSKMLQSSGFAITFAYSGAIPVFAKITILGCVLIASLVGYGFLQMQIRGRSLLSFDRQSRGYSITQV